jgi:hypothetical protein
MHVRPAPRRAVLHVSSRGFAAGSTAVCAGMAGSIDIAEVRVTVAKREFFAARSNEDFNEFGSDGNFRPSALAFGVASRFSPNVFGDNSASGFMTRVGMVV